jgi:hypothetical protein
MHPEKETLSFHTKKKRKNSDSESTGTGTEARGSRSVARFIETDADSSAFKQLRCVSRHE